MKQLAKSKKILIIGGAAAVVAIVAGIVIWMMKPKQEAYRIIQVYQIDGRAEVTREAQKTITPYVNMMLQNKDEVRTFEESYLYLKMDEDKYLLTEPDTRLKLVATGSSKNSKTLINIEEGAVVNHITSPLNDKSSYEVNTPNSTMAVRGTSFRVYVWYDEEGVSHTILQVFEGVVEVRLIYPDGSAGNETRSFGKGQTVSIWGSDKTSNYDEVQDEIDYIQLEIPTLEFLKIGIEGLDNYNITIPDVEDIIVLKQTYFDVTFKVGDNVFGTQSILFDHYVSEPSLRPTPKGRWDFDFDIPIREAKEIQWIEE